MMRTPSANRGSRGVRHGSREIVHKSIRGRRARRRGFEKERMAMLMAVGRKHGWTPDHVLSAAELEMLDDLVDRLRRRWLPHELFD